MRLRVIFGIHLLCLLNGLLLAQSPEKCYERFLQEAIIAQQANYFDLAIHKFEAANICPDKPLENDIDSLLKAVSTIKIEALTQATREAKAAETKAKKAELETRNQLIISEGARLAFLANQEREKGNIKGALKLAYRAMEITGDKASPAVHRAFGDAVYQSTKKELNGHRQSIRFVDFSPDGKLLLTFSNDSTVIIWKSNGDKLLHLQQFNTNIQSAQFSPNGQHILTASGNSVELWNLQGERIQQFNGHQQLVYEAVFSTNGQRIATCSRDQSIGLWDSTSGQQIASCVGPKAAITQVHFSNDDQFLLSVSADKSIWIWNQKGEVIQNIKHNDLYFSGAVFGPKAGQLLTFTIDYALQIWELDSGQLLTEIKEHQGVIRQVQVAPDLSGFLSCSADRLAILWDADGKERYRLDNHLEVVNKIDFSEDGTFLLTCSKDGTAKLYHKNSELIMDISGFSGPVNDIAISSSNQQIAAVSQNNVVYLCQNPRTYYPYLKTHPPEAFTKKEKEKYTILD